jgi:TonB-linked SusC/RagA family outer membrane protein
MKKKLSNTILTVMKVFLLLIAIGLTSAYGNTALGQAKVDIDVKNISIEQLFKEIQNKSGYIFFYEDNVLKTYKKISLKLSNVKVSKILDEAFLNTDLTFKIIDKQIVVKKNKNKNSESSKDKQTILQEKVVSGIVTDRRGQPLPGVNILIQGTTKGVQTDFDGKYLIEANQGAVLIISYIGMITKIITVGIDSVINVVLNEDTASLDEVVLIGYGTVKKADLTGSVSQVKTETLETFPVYNMEQALKVGAAGVRVSQNSGTPGGRIEVRIRGGNSLIGGNQPLYVVDGFPITGGIDFLNPSDIESVDILKDASATAIYGSRGANGVVIITSKRGSRGQDDKIEVNSFFGMQQAINKYDLLDAKEYAVIANEWLKNDGIDPFFNVGEVQNPGTDWWDAIFRVAPVQNHTITFSGSSEKGRYSISGNYYDQEGIIENSGVTRGSVRLNLDQKLKSWLEMGVNLQINRPKLRFR